MPKPDRLVLFDIDGTLLRGAGPHHKEALISGVRKVTRRQTSFDGIETAGTLDHDLIIRLLQNGGHSREEILNQLPEIGEACETAYFGNCPTDLSARLCPGVLDLLQNIDQSGIPIGVVTGNLAKIGWKKLELAGIRDYFSVGAFSQDGRTRAELAAVAAARAREKKLVATNCTVALIGDHRNDIEAAHENGFRSIAVATGFLSVEQLSSFSPDVVVPDLTSLSAARVFPS
jgi:phosphoglycolate phosphatase